ncbi:hypothetical protein MTAT_19310 [Moorella thermoacetica]|uniref:Uncharacterized protein n=1 Tax=Neomoorella thermoacetica TaxID=1525 RepID=A0AAC9HIX9_NEOTH|nr:hypothetical protein [Moorella thermoacetica]AOQ24588.1 hypothetical protein Maut_02158 [Moorella thermoacetica]TYL12689.1 hypothetical protein MTAT_19310 [Moorella thermoacetica]
MSKKCYLLPVSWVMADYVEVEANSLEQAVARAFDVWDKPEATKKREYVDFSFEVHPEDACVIFLSRDEK